MNIYVFQLESNSIFVYPSRKIDPTFRELALEMTIYYDFVKKRPPIKIIETLHDRTMMDVDTTVKKYTLFFDFMQVRGGTYYAETLSDALSKSLKEELELISCIDLPNIEYIEYIIQTYKYNLNGLIENNTRINMLETLEKYKKDKANYTDIQQFVVNHTAPFVTVVDETQYNKTYIIDENVLSQIKEIKQSILVEDGMVDEEISEIYPKILIYLKRIYTILIKYEYDISNGLDICFADMVYIKNPEFALDAFVYTKYLNNIITKTQRDCAIRILCYFETMCQKVLNMIDECIFDLQTYEPDIEWKYTRAIYYIDCLLATHIGST